MGGVSRPECGLNIPTRALCRIQFKASGAGVLPCRLKFTFVYANLVYGLSVRGLVCVCVCVGVCVCVFAVQNAVEAFQFGVVRAVDGLWGRDFECGLRFFAACARSGSRPLG